MPAEPTVAALASALVAIDSVNPDLVPGATGEGEIAAFVAGWLREAGLEVTLEEAAPGRPNVVGVARGTGGGRSLLLNAHMDTVGVAGMAEPFSGRIEDGRLFGRGSYDMKGALAAIMAAGAQAATMHLRGDVIVAAVADEEVASVGTEALVRRWRADAAVVAESTEEQLAVAHKGFVGFAIDAAGRAAHGSRPDLGIDAIARTGPVLVRLAELDVQLRSHPGHQLLGTGSIHASVIQGGQEYSSYPASCRLVGERRTVPGETMEQVEREVRALLGDVEGTYEITFAREPFENPVDDEIVALVARHAVSPEIVGMPFWADSALLRSAGIPTVLYGPRGEGAHAEVEWVDVASLERCVETYVAVAAELCA